MARNLLTVLLAIFLTAQSSAQSGLKQFFDGADTSVNSGLIISLDSSSNNIWQIGKPQKTLFYRASTLPNAIITDTLNPYPPNDTSSFKFNFRMSAFPGRPIVAIRWKQKLDMVSHHSGGILEFSRNGGTWENAFNNPDVYNFYGYLQDNEDTKTKEKA